MIAEKSQGRTVASTLGAAGARNHQMTVAQDAMAHVMDVMRNLYSNVIRAMIREYSTNAWDAHVEAGNTARPIEVTLPTMMSPFLRVRDFGIGLDEDGIRTIYSQYGASTKRSTDEQTGMLGMGCKSALGYTDQFSVVSVKNGRRIKVSIELDDDGLGTMRVMSRDPLGDPTTDPDGTEILIPCGGGDYPKFQSEAEFFFSVWPESTVLINGQKPARVDGMKLTDDLLVIEGDTSYVVMGNVPYPAQISHSLPRGWGVDSKSIMAFVPIGAVNFTPAREGLRPTRNTTNTIARIEREIANALRGAVQREIDAVASPRAAIQACLRWAASLGAETDPAAYTYQGKTLPQKFTPANKFTVSAGDGRDKTIAMLVTENYHKRLSASSDRESLPVGMWDGTVFLYGYNLRAVSAPQKRKMQEYCRSKGIMDDIKRFVLLADKPDAEHMAYFGADRVVPWATVHAIKLPQTNTGSGSRLYGRLPGSYDFYSSDPGETSASWNTGVSGDAIDQSRPIYYVHGSYADGSRYAHLLAEHHTATGCYVVCLGANRIAKFCRIIPTAKTAHEGVKAAWKIVSAGFSADELTALHIADQHDRSDLSSLDEARISDPDLREAIRLAQLDIQTLIDRRRKFSRAVDTATLDTVEWSNPLDNYPVYQHFYAGYGGRHVKHSDDMYLYFAAKYASITTKGA